MEQLQTGEYFPGRTNEMLQDTTAHFRTNRCFNVDGLWYFNTREDRVPHGPYTSKQNALVAVGDYIVLMNSFIQKH